MLICVGIAGNHLWGIRTSIIVFSVNSILLVMSWFVLGDGFVKKTLLSTFIYPVFLEMIQRIPGITTMTDNILLAAIFGGLLVGLSMGLVVRAGGLTGGTDIIAMMLNKKTSLSVGATSLAFLTINQINEVNGQGFTRERIAYEEFKTGRVRVYASANY